MKINSIKYFSKEAFKNVFSNGWMSLASIFTVVASLMMFGIFMVMVLNINHMMTKIEADYEITLTVDEAYDAEQTEQLGKVLATIPNVSEVIFESKAERMELLRDQFGDNASLLDTYQNEKNPLRDWYKIRCIDLSKSSETVSEVKQLGGVAKVISNGETIRKLTAASGYISRMSVWIMLALTIISIFIISNTIKLTVFSRSREINIMKFVGATDWFIRWPFIIEGMLIGVIGAVVSGVIMSFAYEGLINMFASLQIGFVDFIDLKDIVLVINLVFFFMGIGLGAAGSLISVRKHLKV
ncbi:MAG: permease-like cell division protein FtsX [Clostridia bacterium]|nr:permease-like cell division protein FtsX [Clostridia bacterium]